MKFGVVVFPGSNCDQDLVETLSNLFEAPVVKLWHKDTDLQNCTHIFLPGGFSYGDYLRSGAIAKLSPIMSSVKAHAEKGGFVMGICNGFQILCESGLLPGALLRNTNQKFICKDVNITVSNNNKYSKLASLNVMKVPIAHGEGNYYADKETLSELAKNNQILFQYCNTNGELGDDFNPNGSINHIAGICNKGGNIIGMMPHPERCAADFLHNTDGANLLKALLS